MLAPISLLASPSKTDSAALRSWRLSLPQGVSSFATCGQAGPDRRPSHVSSRSDPREAVAWRRSRHAEAGQTPLLPIAKPRGDDEDPAFEPVCVCNGQQFVRFPPPGALFEQHNVERVGRPSRRSIPSSIEAQHCSSMSEAASAMARLSRTTARSSISRIRIIGSGAPVRVLYAASGKCRKTITKRQGAQASPTCARGRTHSRSISTATARWSIGRRQSAVFLAGVEHHALHSGQGPAFDDYGRAGYQAGPRHATRPELTTDCTA